MMLMPNFASVRYCTAIIHAVNPGWFSVVLVLLVFPISQNWEKAIQQTMSTFCLPRAHFAVADLLHNLLWRNSDNYREKLVEK